MQLFAVLMLLTSALNFETQAADDGCKTERNNYLDKICKHLHRQKRQSSANARHVFSKDVDNPRHVVDRSESDKTGFRSPLKPRQGAENSYSRHSNDESDNSYAEFRSPRLDSRLWPGGEVPYTIDEAMNGPQRCTIYYAMDEIEFSSSGSVAFKCAGKDARIYLKILLNKKDDTCYSKNVGRYLLDNEVHLSPDGCFDKMIVIHELMHVLGFFHEQVRYDRDEFVTVNIPKVEKDGSLKQFDVGGSIFNEQVDSAGYDYESVMHYPDDGSMQAIKTPIDINTQRMGWYYMHGDRLSPKDKIKLKNLYQGLSTEDKLLIGGDKNWINQPKQPINIQIFESTGESYAQDELINKITEMYALTKDIAMSTNQTEWLYQRLVDAGLTQLKYDQHMLMIVGESMVPSWMDVNSETEPKNNRKNYNATKVERTHFQLDGKVEVIVVAQRRPEHIADMNPPCNCAPSAETTQKTFQELNKPEQPKTVDIKQKLNAIDNVDDWSALTTNPSTVVFDSYYQRCICWHEVPNPIRFLEPRKRSVSFSRNFPTLRVYTWRAFYGYIEPPITNQQQQQPSESNSAHNAPQGNNEAASADTGSAVGSASGDALATALAVPLSTGLVLGIIFQSCDPNLISVQNGVVQQNTYTNGQQAVVTCNVAGAQIYSTTQDTTALAVNNQAAFPITTPPICQNNQWVGDTSLKCKYCPTGFVLNVDDNYCIEYFQTSTSWNSASAACSALAPAQSSQLLVLGSTNFGYLQTYFAPLSSTNYWIGLEAPAGTWQWVDGTAITFPTSTGYAMYPWCSSGCPIFASSYCASVHIDPVAPNVRFLDQICIGSFPAYMCQANSS